MVILYKATWQRVRGVHLPSKFHRSQSNPASYWMCRKKSVPWKPHLATRIRARSWIWLVQACPTNALSNWDLRYLEDRWLTCTLCQGPWVIPEQSSHGTLSCCGDHCHRGVMLLGQQQCLGGWCMASIPGPKGNQQNIWLLRDDPCYSLHPSVVFMFWMIVVWLKLWLVARSLYFVVSNFTLRSYFDNVCLEPSLKHVDWRWASLLHFDFRLQIAVHHS